MNPLIADILVQVNCGKQRVKPELKTIKSMVIPSDDIEEINRTSVSRILKHLGYKDGKYKEAIQEGTVRCIKVLKHRTINGY